MTDFDDLLYVEILPTSLREDGSQDIDLKYCNRCMQKKPVSRFYAKTTICKDCVKARSRCVHDRVKTQCQDCKGSAFCIHECRKVYCKLCKGSALCVHAIAKDFCKLCGGKRLCSHGYQKSYCKICKGTQICLHNKTKAYCKLCQGNMICDHNKDKRRCAECLSSSEQSEGLQQSSQATNLLGDMK